MNETIQTDTKKQEPAKIAPSKLERHVPPSLGNDKRASIPCKVVLFAKPLNIAGDESATRVKCEEPRSGVTQRRWSASVIPHLQSIEIHYFPHQQEQPVLVCYVSLAAVDVWFPA